ncbi:MAG: NAD-dependent epimerase/dehydratase family protein, partial [Myxococcales bacterium]|nr:NAD-dependent epimerase/dehydratase family protein [Myxococcales bacterium]
MASKQRVLVAGGAGFLGSHLCDRLVAAGHPVLC